MGIYNLEFPKPIEGHTATKIFNRLSGQPDSYARNKNYVYGKVLGCGTFGVVRKALNRQTNEQVAVKIILKKTLRGNYNMVYDELKLLQQLNHPHIVGFRDWFESKDKFYIVTQLATGGELFDRIVSRGKFTEKDAAVCISQILDALSYIHSKHIVHRDLKPENVLYLRSEEEDPNSPIVLADFGIAKKLESPNEMITSTAGSFGYAAPEVLSGFAHSKACDIWSIGVITYTLLCGYSPFRSETINDFLLEVQNDNCVVFHKRFWKNISVDAKYFILSMLRIDPNERPTADQLLNNIWIKKTASENSSCDLLPNIREGFNARTKFRQVIEVVKFNNRIKALKEQANSEESDDDDGFADLGSTSPKLIPPETTASSSTLVNIFSSLANRAKSPRNSLTPPKPSRNSLTPTNTSSSSSSSHSRTKSDLTIKAFQQMVITAQQNKERIINDQNNTQK
ncbi:serine/threonine-protein kinase [Ascoidea rubescens DSM 1968]|uniref:calcium/calmodulin-dependent protein kinase n=1 Tax=Ascoidea rubescens DSM 1968 TaxID=1344418 RepID=A0A1D2VRY3_9ASCO|nr:Pkinase-domain-containing protein [Ascoidea rubescens DSM 1968]ODV64359.1 Pkinase-domain-containing protein [Ascoidea rubescens DSM 1968]